MLDTYLEQLKQNAFQPRAEIKTTPSAAELFSIHQGIPFR
jgi:hypothetical protein